MKFQDRVQEAVQVGLAEARRDPKQMAKIVGAGVVIVGSLAFGAFQLFGGPSEPPAQQLTPQEITNIQQVTQELEAATAEETEAFEAAVAAGEVQPPPEAPPDVVAPLGAKGMNYMPGFDPANPPPPPEPAPMQDPEPEPEPEPEPDPG